MFSWIVKSANNKQNNPEFDKKLTDTQATLIDKRRQEGYGILYFDTDGNAGTIEARMTVPIDSGKQDVVFQELKPGGQDSLLNFKRCFESRAETTYIKPGRYVDVELFKSARQK